MRHGRLAASCVVGLVVGLGTGCAAGPRPGPLAPADVVALEAQAAQHPDDAALALSLAKAYYAADRFADARRVAGDLVRANAANSDARTYLGLSYEALTQFDSARAVYADLLASKIPGRLRRFLSGRVALLTREELRYAARQAIARESSLVRTSPDPNTVAVMPFRYTGTDTTYRPLERGLAAIVVTDLGRVSRLRLVERARVQVLLDELKLAESGRVDPTTGARSGRLVGAGQVVEGQFTTGPDQVRIDATVVRAADAGVAAAGSTADRLRALFDVEKAVVFQLLAKLGITLTPAERVAISERPTRDLEAFLLYSRGLEAEDRGDFTTATEDYQRAARRDPAFRAAAQQAAVSQATAAAQGAPPPDVASVALEVPAASSTLLTAINGAVPTGAVVLESVATAATIVLPAADPNRLCEGAACDGPGRATLVGTVIIIIKRPCMRPRRSLGCAALTLVGLIEPTRLTGQVSDALYARFSALTGWELRGYSFDSGIVTRSASQWNIPVVVAAPLGRKLSVDLSTHYVSGHIEPSSGTAETLSGFTDTQVRFLYTVNRDRLVGTLSFNLPTGMHTVSTSQFQVAAAVGSNYLSFPVWSLGTALGLTGGVAYAARAGSWGVGVSGSVRYLGSYEPFADDTLSYKPGVEARVRAGADRLIGRASRLLLGLTISSFSTDVYSGSNAIVPGWYSPGARFISELSFIRVVGRSTLTFSAWDYYRLTGTSNVGPVATTKENVFDGQLRLTYPVAPRLQLEPMLGFRQWSPEDYRGGRLRSGGVLARVGLTDRLAATVSGRYEGGWIFVRGLGSHTSLTGYGASVLLRYER